MAQVETLLRKLSEKTDLRIGGVDAHDDDPATRGHIEAQTRHIGKHLLTLVDVSLGDKDYAPHKTNVQGGGRKQEGIASAAKLGYWTFDRLDGQDRGLSHDIPRLTEEAAEWMSRYAINVVFSMGELDDHESGDHLAAGGVALGAARLVAEAENRAIGVFAVHPTHSPVGEWVARDTPIGRAILHESLAQSPSQFRYIDPNLGDGAYIPVTPELALHRKEYGEIGVYPIEQDSTYTFHQVGGLLLPQTAELVYA